MEQIESQDGLGITGEQLRELVWEGLLASVPQYRTLEAARQSYIEWFNKEPDYGTDTKTA